MLPLFPLLQRHSINEKEPLFSESEEYLLQIKDMCVSDSDKIFLIVDFTKPSCEERFYAVKYVNGERILLHSCMVLHGYGGGSTAKTPVFSNRLGSKCSSLGLYELLKTDTMRIGRPCIRLKGLSETNSNAQRRGILIHPTHLTETIPGPIKGASFPLSHESEGCFSIGYDDFEIIRNLFINQKDMKLYAHYRLSVCPRK